LPTKLSNENIGLKTCHCAIPGVGFDLSASNEPF
jgi:hypothetical protein